MFLAIFYKYFITEMFSILCLTNNLSPQEDDGGREWLQVLLKRLGRNIIAV